MWWKMKVWTPQGLWIDGNQMLEIWFTVKSGSLCLDNLSCLHVSNSCLVLFQYLFVYLELNS